MKNKLVICLLTRTIALSGCGTSNAFKAGMQAALDDTQEQTAPVKEVSTETETEETEISSNTEESSEETNQTQATEKENTEVSTASAEKSAESETTEETETIEAIKSGSYTIDGIVFSFDDSVRNDVTGNWKISLISDSATPDEYALDYYKTLFSSDDEIHAVINFALNTTNKISVLYGGILDVSVLEYVDGEEHDAKELFSGSLLNEYWVHTDTGEVEKIQ